MKQIKSSKVVSTIKDELTNRFGQYAMNVAYALVHKYKNAGLSQDELESYAIEGLWKAERSFNPDKGAKFTTYAFQIVKNAILDGISKNRDQCLTVRENLLRNKIHAYMSEYYGTYGEMPLHEEIADHLGIKTSKVTQLLSCSRTYSIDEVWGDEEAENPILSHLAADDSFGIEADSECYYWKELMKQLPEREERILHKRFLEDQTLVEVAAQENLTDEGVRKIEKKAIKKLQLSCKTTYCYNYI